MDFGRKVYRTFFKVVAAVFLSFIYYVVLKPFITAWLTANSTTLDDNTIRVIVFIPLFLFGIMLFFAFWDWIKPPDEKQRGRYR